MSDELYSLYNLYNLYNLQIMFIKFGQLLKDDELIICNTILYILVFMIWLLSVLNYIIMIRVGLTTYEYNVTIFILLTTAFGHQVYPENDQKSHKNRLTIIAPPAAGVFHYELLTGPVHGGQPGASHSPLLIISIQFLLHL